MDLLNLDGLVRNNQVKKQDKLGSKNREILLHLQESTNICLDFSLDFPVVRKDAEYSCNSKNF